MTTYALAEEYDATLIEGEALIRNRWQALDASTRHALFLSGFYSERGERLQVEPHSTENPQAEVERLEHVLGVLKRCAASKVPTRSQLGAPIPGEALTGDVLTACEDLLLVQAWHDPVFLRLALAALAAHEEASALTGVGPAREGWSVAVLAIGGFLLKLGLVLLTPAALALGLVAAVNHNVLGSIAAFYVLGAGLLAAMSLKATGKEPDLFERAHMAWSKFRGLRRGAVVGSGARFYLERMARDGVDVPAVAFDLCAVLQGRAQSNTATYRQHADPPRRGA